MFERILYPTDFGEYAWPNLACVLQSLPTCQEVILVHVVDVEKLQHNLLPGYLAEDEGRIRALAEQRSDGWVRDLKSRGIEARCFIPTGVPSIEILKIARREHPDLVMGYVGRSGWRNAIWGSTTERVVRHTAQVVLVIKGDRTAPA